MTEIAEKIFNISDLKKDELYHSKKESIEKLRKLYSGNMNDARVRETPGAKKYDWGTHDHWVGRGYFWLKGRDKKDNYYA